MWGLSWAHGVPVKLGDRIGGMEPWVVVGSTAACVTTPFPMPQFPHWGNGYRNSSHSPLRLSAHDKLVAVLPSQSCSPYVHPQPLPGSRAADMAD